MWKPELTTKYKLSPFYTTIKLQIKHNQGNQITTLFNQFHYTGWTMN